MKSYLKAGFWYVICNIAIKGISFLTLPIFTSLLTPSDFGIYALYISYESIISIIMGCGLAATVKNAKVDYTDNFFKYLSSIIALTCLAFIVSLPLLLAIGNFFFVAPLNTKWIIVLLSANSFATSIISLITTKYIIFNEYKENVILTAVFTLSNIIISLFLCFWIFENDRCYARIVGSALPAIVLALIIVCHYLRIGRAFYSKIYWRYAVNIGTPLILHGLSLVVMLQSDRVVIGKYCGAAFVGVYSVAATLAGTLSILMGALDNAWAPWFWEKMANKEYASLKKGNKTYALSFMYVACMILLLSPEIISVAVSHKYLGISDVFVPLCVAVFLNFMYLFPVNQEYFFKETRFIALSTVLAAALNIVLNIVLVKKYGFVAAAYATVISRAVLFAAHWYFLRYVDDEKIVDIMILLKAFAFVLVVSALVLNVNSVSVRLFFAALLSLLAYKFLKKTNFDYKSNKI